MRKTKKFMALFLLLSLLLATGSFAYADTAGIGDGGKALIRTALAQIEPQKESFGYAELDFAALEVGEPIAAYDLVNESPIFSRNVYPLFQNDSLVLLGFEVNTGDGSYIQITSSLVDRINDLADFDEPVALLYDNANCYLCSAEGIHLLIAGESQNTGRSNLNFMTQEVVIASVAKTKLRPSVSLNYVSTAMASPRVQVYYSCICLFGKFPFMLNPSG